MSRVIYGTPYAPMTARDAVKIRRLLLMVVDASRAPHGDWTLQEAGPSGVDLALAATETMIEASAQQYADAFGRMIREWQESVIAFRCSLNAQDVIRLGGPTPWHCADVKFSLATLSVDELDSPLREQIEAIPTRLTLKPDQIDTALDGARAATLAHPRVRTYLQERVPAVR